MLFAIVECLTFFFNYIYSPSYLLVFIWWLFILLFFLPFHEIIPLDNETESTYLFHLSNFVTRKIWNTLRSNYNSFNLIGKADFAHNKNIDNIFLLRMFVKLGSRWLYFLCLWTKTSNISFNTCSIVLIFVDICN